MTESSSSSSSSKTNSCSMNKWRIIPIVVIFLITLAVLLSVYRIRGDQPSTSHAAASSSRHSTKSGGTRSRGKELKSVWEEGRTNDRWLVVTDDQDTAFICALADVSAELEWRMLVVGNNITCCRRTCMLLDDLKLKSLNYEIMAAMEPTARVEARRNAAYLYSIQHGARHIFDAYPETYVSAKIPLETFKREMHRQLQNVALNVALGVVSERPYVKRVQNPYAHFGRSDLWTEGFRRNNQRFIHNHIYRICEVRPPSIEKFLDIDEDYFDWAAPPLTLPGSTVAPFSSKNTLYSIEAFWGLVLFPAANSSQAPTIPPHLLRTLWNQAVLGDIAGSLKLSLANVSTLQRREKHRKNPADLREPDGLASFLLKWTCSTRSSLSCTRDLFQAMFQFHYISFRSLGFLQSWINDLLRSHYLEPPVIPRRRGQMNPCLGADGLYGVAFYPALPVKSMSAEQFSRRNATLDRYRKEEALLDLLNRAQSETIVGESESTQVTQGPGNTAVAYIAGEQQGSSSTKGEGEGEEEEPVVADADGAHESSITARHAKVYDSHGSVDMPIVREFTDNACPGYSQLLPHVPENPFKNILLIVAMTAMRYEMIPMFEVVYREHFRNILYCGSPHDSIEIFLRKYQLSEDRSFSFLPIHSKYTYECLLGALEMGYNVDGWIMSTDDALINTWNVRHMNFSKLWYSGDYNTQVSGANWKTLDPGNQKLPRSLDGVQKVLEFLKSSLIGSVLPDEVFVSRGNHGEHHDHSKITKREAEAEIPVTFSDKSILDKPVIVVETARNVTDERPLHDAGRRLAEQPLNLHHKGGKLIFDLIELKSVADKSDEELNPKKLSSFNYALLNDDNKTSHQVSTELQQVDTTTSREHADSDEFEGQLAMDKQNASSNGTTRIETVTLVDGEGQTSAEFVHSVPAIVPEHSGESVKVDDIHLSPVESDEDDSSAEDDGHAASSGGNPVQSDEDGQSSEQDDSGSDEVETERPVSEVLRKLLVATRNNTNQEPSDLNAVAEVAKNVSSPLNVTSAAAAVSLEENDNHTIYTPEIEITIITDAIVSVETEEESDRNKPATRENPVIDLFLHPVNSSTDSLHPENTSAVNESDDSSPNKEVTEEFHQVAQVQLNATESVESISSVDTNSTIAPSADERKVSEEVSTTTTTTKPTVTNSTTSAPIESQKEEERKNAQQEESYSIDDTLSTLKELYTSIKENLGVRSDDLDVASYADAIFFGGDRGYRLNPKSIHHFHCEKGTNLEFCRVSSEFLYQLSENVGKDFRLIYDKVPMYYIPKKDQLKFYLLSNLMLQHGVTDEIAIPLILSGLGPEEEWVKLEKSYFGGLKSRNGDSSKYPFFNSAAAVLFPTDLNTLTTDPKLQKTFCLKYLLKTLQL